MPVGPGAVLLHAQVSWFLNTYSIFQKEIEVGRMSYYDFSRAVDRIFISKGKQGIYNTYFSLEEADVDSPIMVFVNRCSIGMSPYYDVYIPQLYHRGMTPPKSKLYAYFKRSKDRFNCCEIK